MGNNDILQLQNIITDRENITIHSKPLLIKDNVKIGRWEGAKEWGDTGIFAVDGSIAFSAFEIASVPDFSSQRFPDLARLSESQRVKEVGERQNQFLAALHSLGSNFAISLRYYYEKSDNDVGKIRLFLIGRCYSNNSEEAKDNIYKFREIVHRTFPHGYGLIDLHNQKPELYDSVILLDGISSMAEILKQEKLLTPWHAPEVCGFSFYYLPLPFSPAENSMIDFCRSLTNDPLGRKVIIDICLLPTGQITNTEKLALEDLSNLCNKWRKDQQFKIGGGLFSDPTSIEIAADPNAERAQKIYTELLQRYGTQSRNFIYAFRVLWWEDSPPEHVASALASFALAPNSESYISLITRQHPSFQKALNAAKFCYVTPAVYNENIWQYDESPETIRRLHRMVNLQEAAGFFRLPIPGHDGCPGIPLDTGLTRLVQTATLDRIVLGAFLDVPDSGKQKAVFSIDDLTKHCLIVGTTGSGKTTICFSILKQLWENYNIPFIVLEPAKTEYRALRKMKCFQDDLLIFTVGKEYVSPLRFNPFEMPTGLSLSEHISALNSSFPSLFKDFWEPLPQILDEAIHEVYLENGWSEFQKNGDIPGIEFPTIEDLYHKALLIAESKSYKGETSGNIRGALETRLGSLLRGNKGRCFNTRYSIPFNILMEKPVILELDGLNTQEKALMMMFILTMIREYSKTNHKIGSRLNHVLLVEEAHNLLERDLQKSEPSREEAIRYFVNMLSEIRAYGEGIIIADQMPTKVASEAVKNTNIKIMHRLVAADDREILGKAMVLDSGQFHQAALLSPGQSFVFMEGWAKSRLIIEDDLKESYSIKIPPDDNTVRDWMKNFPRQEEVRNAYLPYLGCSDFCIICNNSIREKAERFLQSKLKLLPKTIDAEISFDISKTGTYFSHFFKDFNTSPNDRVLWGCTFLHFTEKILKRS